MKRFEEYADEDRLFVSEFFSSDEELGAALATVQFRFSAVLLNAVDPRTGRGTGRDNYVCGVGARVYNLVSYVAHRVNLRGVVTYHFPRGVTQRGKAKQLASIHEKLLTMVALNWMKTQDLYWLDGDWCFTNVVREDHDRIMRILREKSNTYQKDNRAFHGRPANQGRRRTKELRQAPGVSIGVASY